MTERSLPPLAAIRCFEAAARLSSFTRAGEELGMTQAAVSYQIRVLEERLGAPLFARSARGVTLTEAGKRLAPAVGESFAQLRAAFAQFRAVDDAVLAITVTTTFASSWLMPRIGGFQLKHPNLAVRVDASNALVDLARDGFDIGIRIGTGRWPGLVAHALLPVSFAPMLSPRLIARSGPVETPADLLRLPLIDAADPWWAEWFAAAGVAHGDLTARGGVSVLNQNLAARAALVGQGVAILMPALFPDEVAEGRLVQPFPLLKHDPDIGYWLVYPEARKHAAPVRAFRDWIMAEMRDAR